MNSKYLGKACVVCNQVFKDGDDIVVCPVCGSPHHRSCYEKLGHCQNESLHETGGEWTPPSQWGEQNEEVIDGDAPLRCPRCATLCKPGTLFCPVCGTSLTAQRRDPQVMDFEEFLRRQQGQNGGASRNQDPANHPNYDQRYSSHGDRSGNASGQTPPGWSRGENPIPNVPPIQPNPFTTPYGGVAPDEVIDGVAAKDLVIYVGPNSHYFLPKFKQIAEKQRSFQWNWSAFFLHFAYFFYRKMYLVGGIFLAAYLLAELPLFILLPEYVEFLYQQLTSGSVLAAVPQQVQLYLNYSTASNFILLLINMAAAAVANRAYFRKARKDIRAIKQETGEEKPYPREESVDSPEYFAALARKGRVNMRLVAVMLLVMAFINFGIPALMVLWLM